MEGFLPQNHSLARRARKGFHSATSANVIHSATSANVNQAVVRRLTKSTRHRDRKRIMLRAGDSAAHLCASWSPFWVEPTAPSI